MQDRLRVIYIMGIGRSGSTLLDAILGNHSSIANHGELDRLVADGFIGNGLNSDGVPCNETPFWRQVLADWRGHHTLRDLSAYVALQSRLERRRGLAEIVSAKSRPTASMEQYVHLTGGLLRSIQAVGGRRFLVDSSKRPVRAVALSLIPGIDLRIVHLVRDGRGVMWSCLKAFRRAPELGLESQVDPTPAHRTALTWVEGNLMSELARKLAGVPCRRVRYEDLASAPSRTVAGLLEFLGLADDGLVAAVQNGPLENVGNVIAGNRLRLKEQLRIVPDLEWMTSLSARDRLSYWLVAGWLGLRYGYR